MFSGETTNTVPILYVLNIHGGFLVEDETHFLLQCPVLENKRTQIINNIKNVNTNFNNLPNKSKLIWLMSSEDNFIIKNTSSLLCSLFKERDLVLKGN